jgi:hypothetical protein
MKAMVDYSLKKSIVILPIPCIGESFVALVVEVFQYLDDLFLFYLYNKNLFPFCLISISSIHFSTVIIGKSRTFTLLSH